MADSAVDLLKQDHKKVKGLLKELVEGTGDRLATLEKIEKEVKTHAHVEETIFYPAYRDTLDEREARVLVEESLEEHAVVDKIISDMRDLEPNSAEFVGKAKVLKESITHHADEEEKEMFPKAEKSMNVARLRELGREMRDEKKGYSPKQVITR